MLSRHISVLIDDNGPAESRYLVRLDVDPAGDRGYQEILGRYDNLEDASKAARVASDEHGCHYSAPVLA